MDLPQKINGLSLFSGIGGIDLALRDYVRTIAYCEIDPYCRGVLLSRMADESLCDGPIWDDIKTLDGDIFHAAIDIVFGGFPCQDISVAGLGKGLEGERSGLFFEILRVAKQIKPNFIFLENVPAITTRGGLRVVREIAEMGYDCRWRVISANEWVDQKRERWFLLAKLNCERLQKRARKALQSPRETSLNEEPGDYKLQDMECWGAFARGLRKTERIPYKMDRIKALGNSVCPGQCKEAFETLIGIKAFDN